MRVSECWSYDFTKLGLVKSWGILELCIQRTRFGAVVVNVRVVLRRTRFDRIVVIFWSYVSGKQRLVKRC